MTKKPKTGKNLTLALPEKYLSYLEMTKFGTSCVGQPMLGLKDSRSFEGGRSAATSELLPGVVVEQGSCCETMTSPAKVSVPKMTETKGKLKRMRQNALLSDAIWRRWLEVLKW